MNRLSEVCILSPRLSSAICHPAANPGQPAMLCLWLATTEQMHHMNPNINLH